MFEEIEGYITNKPNMLLIPVTRLSLTETEAERFNVYYKFCLENISKKITRTPSGGISITSARGNQYDIRSTSTMVELTIKWESKWMRIQMHSNKIKEGEKKVHSGRQSWEIFKKVCEKYGIDVKNYYIPFDDGIEKKFAIPKPICKLGREDFAGKTFTNVHHIDYNSSYAYGIIKACPDLEKPIKELYEKRKENTEYKTVLAQLHGVMQSSLVNYQLSHIALEANKDNVKRIVKMASNLRNSGRRIILYNIDGIWYQGDIYHDENEGKNIGQWKNDHINCKFRPKSDGIYEFIEDGIYHPVYRGTSSFEKEKPRSEWEWGDIFKGSVVTFEFDEKEGFKKNA